LLSGYSPPPVSNNSIGSTSYTYNQDVDIARFVRPDGIALAPTYDSAGRWASVTDGTETRTFAYDATSGRLSSITTAGGTTVSFSRDGFLLTDASWTGAVAGSIHWTYDNNFRIALEQVLGTPAVAFAYDADGLTTSAGNESLSYDSQNGALVGSTVGSVVDSYTYSLLGEVATYAAHYQSTNLLSVTYTRDNAGRIAAKQETIDGQSHTTSYQYDSRGRLAQVMLDGAPVESYQYDANGNRTQLVSNGVTTAGSYDAQDKLLQWGNASFAYNANGDVVALSDANGTTTYASDGFGVLRRVTLPSGSVIDYVVDGRGRRVAKNVNGSRHVAWIYADGLKPIAELDASGNVVSRFVYGRTSRVPDYMIRGGATYRFITDHNGSVRILVDVAAGTVAQRIDYDAWGNVIQDTNPGFQPFGFAGGIYDPDSRLVRFGAREYDARTGRWMRRDPVSFAGLATNLYGYAYDDPINFVDSSGLYVSGAALAAAEAEGAAATGAGVAAESTAASAAASASTGLVGVTGAVTSTVTGGIVVGAISGPLGIVAAAVVNAQDEPAADEGVEEGGADQKQPCKRESSRKLRKKWEDAYGKKWPKDPKTGWNQDVAHKKALADKGTNDLENIGPQPHDEHMQEHMDNGDFARWGARGGGAKK
jgi:RHS repeat-associated protein